jgi:hypothetical protein
MIRTGFFFAIQLDKQIGVACACDFAWLSFVKDLPVNFSRYLVIVSDVLHSVAHE